MAKFPHSPGVGTLKQLTPTTLMLPAGTRLARVYYTGSRYAMAWNSFRYTGPVNARWDHHLPKEGGVPVEQQRGIYYAASDAKTCLAEFFQETRCIDRAYQAPWLVVFDTEAPLLVLDLTGDFVTRMRASMAIHSGTRVRAREWARDLYVAFENIQGINYASSMNAGAPALAINERAVASEIFPARPAFHRALGDDVMLDPLKHAALALGYALR
ncbi:MAG TPA: RES family NAD+ phosphorylase [Steroidobacteraceae bacterium]